jgi:hypothetical protein
MARDNRSSTLFLAMAASRHGKPSLQRPPLGTANAGQSAFLSIELSAPLLGGVVVPGLVGGARTLFQLTTALPKLVY